VVGAGRLQDWSKTHVEEHIIDKMRTKVLGYYRPFPWTKIGTDRTGRTNVERELRSFCRSRHLLLAGFFVETDARTSRSFEDRTIGREAMARLRSGVADEVLVWKPEHIFSSAGSTVTTVERWLDEGVGFRCMDFFEGTSLHVGSKAQLLNAESLIRGLAALQRNVNYEQTRARMQSRKAQRAWSGRPPFGFALRNGILVEDHDRIERIQRMKWLHRKGRSYRQIALEFGISVGTAHRLVKTDLRKLRRIASEHDDLLGEDNR